MKHSYANSETCADHAWGLTPGVIQAGGRRVNGTRCQGP